MFLNESNPSRWDSKTVSSSSSRNSTQNASVNGGQAGFPAKSSDSQVNLQLSLQPNDGRRLWLTWQCVVISMQPEEDKLIQNVSNIKEYRWTGSGLPLDNIDNWTKDASKSSTNDGKVWNENLIRANHVTTQSFPPRLFYHCVLINSVPATPLHGD